MTEGWCAGSSSELLPPRLLALPAPVLLLPRLLTLLKLKLPPLTLLLVVRRAPAAEALMTVVWCRDRSVPSFRSVSLGAMSRV